MIIHLIARSAPADRGRAAGRRAARRSRAPTPWWSCPPTRSSACAIRSASARWCWASCDGAPILASETCALDIMGAEFVRDVEPGEVVIATADGIESLRPFAAPPRRFCIFEYVYFARPDSAVEGTERLRGAQADRRRAGARERRRPPTSWCRCPIAACRRRSATPRRRPAVRARADPQPLRRAHLHRALGPHPPSRREAQAQRQPVDLAGKRVVLVDDSIVRGTTSTKIVEMVRDAGADRGAHARSPARRPRIPASTASTRRSAASCWPRRTISRPWPDHRRRQPGVPLDRRPLSRRRRARAATPAQPQYCDACFTGDYPTLLEDFGRGGRRSALADARGALSLARLAARAFFAGACLGRAGDLPETTDT